MVQEIEEQFDYMVPNASGKAKQFLGVVRQRSHDSQIGLDLEPVQTSRGANPRIVMRAEVRLGGAIAKRPYRFEVFADPIGSMLQVGWEVSAPDASRGFLGNTGMGGNIRVIHSIAANNPDTARRLSGLIQAFHHTIFVPTLEQLVAAVNGPPPGTGFLRT